MNSQSDLDVIRAGANAYQNFTTDTASVYHDAALITGMRWSGRASIGLPWREEAGGGLDASFLMRLGYCLGKLCGEAGEANEHYWKYLRDTPGVAIYTDEDRQVTMPVEVRDAIIKELGDAQWYIAQAARVLDVTLGDVMAENLRKLRDRKVRGVLGGSGDDR
jgi:NTP pyrophosphatase (non-canonical NTP hydrolase)